MAFAPGVRARVKLSGPSLLAGSVNPQPPLIGVVQTYIAPLVGLLMEDGRTLTVDEAFLDEINPTAALLANTLIDKVVVGTAVPGTATTAPVPYSDEYIGRVADVYNVGLSIANVLVCSLSNGMYYELAYADVIPLEDR